MAYNLMTCAGFGTGLMGGCSIAWLIFGLLVILTMVANRQINDFTNIEFNQWGGYIGAIVPYVIVITITGNFKIGLAIGLLGMLLGGYFGGQLLGGGGDY